MREYSLNATQSLDAVFSPRHAQALCAAGRTRVFDGGEFICHQGDDARDVYLLARGGVKTVMLNSAGQEALLRIHLPGSVLGLIALTTCGTRDASLIALERSRVVVIARDAMLQLLRTDGDCAVHVIRLLLDRTRDFHMRVVELEANRIDQRLARAAVAQPSRSRRRVRRHSRAHARRTRTVDPLPSSHGDGGAESLRAHRTHRPVETSHRDRRSRATHAALTRLTRPLA
jgi:CRP-like cAMP-binding protein